MTISTIRELLGRSFSRYVRVIPAGFELEHGTVANPIDVIILTSRPARTFYQNKRPVCRSLDGIQSLEEKRSCASCLMRKNCTPQILIELLHDGVPRSIILAYTSARNFFAFIAQMQRSGRAIENAAVRISVRDRGRWGEVCFDRDHVT
jgi:hypothetical protein